MNVYKIFFATLLCCSLVGIGFYTVMLSGSDMLLPAPEQTAQYKEIFVGYNKNIAEYYNKLSDQEKMFIAFMYQASIPGSRILMDQVHRHGVEIFELFKTLYDVRTKLVALETTGALKLVGCSSDDFVDQVKTYLVYLFVNNGQYFKRESENEKRTPGKLGLNLLTEENMVIALQALGMHEQADRIQALKKTMFDASHEPTLTVAGSIEKSAVNIYAKSDVLQDQKTFTMQDFDLLENEVRNSGACYYDVTVTEAGERIPRSTPYSIDGKYADELLKIVAWLQRALQHVTKYPQYFDQHLVKSLEHLIESFQSGSEEAFARHSIEWLKDKSRVSYTFGFIESYLDPLGNVSSFQADVTLQDPDFDLTELSSELPAIEAALPLPAEFKRDVLGSDAALPNASMRLIAVASGDLGPLACTAAYCLPNDPVIRSEHGTKQVIYRADKGLAASINSELTRQLMYLKKRADWFKKNDPDFSIMTDLWNIHVVLHETLGHGSGKYGNHTFQDGESLVVNGATHKIGDVVPVTNANFSKFMMGTDAAIEELRAEIIALYISINHLDTLKKHGLLKKWPQKLSDNELKDWLLFDMANTAVRRIIGQNDDATEITGAHARANCIISNFLIERGGIAWQYEKIDRDGESLEVCGLEVIDREKAIAAVTELMILTQTIKSTAHGLDAQKLIDRYGKPLDVRQCKILKRNDKKIVGDLKARVIMNPHFVLEEQGNGSYKVSASWPNDIFDLIEKWASV